MACPICLFCLLAGFYWLSVPLACVLYSTGILQTRVFREKVAEEDQKPSRVGLVAAEGGGSERRPRGLARKDGQRWVTSGR